MLKFKKFLTVLNEDAGIEDAAADVHSSWMSRPNNKKQDYNAHLHVPYADLPEEEKEKDRAHIHTVGRLFRETPKTDGESDADHHERIADAFGSIAHEEWRKGHEASKGAGTPRMKKVSDGPEVNINVPWRELHPEWKRENLEAGRAAVAAHQKHMTGIAETYRITPKRREVLRSIENKAMQDSTRLTGPSSTSYNSSIRSGAIMARVEAIRAMGLPQERRTGVYQGEKDEKGKYKGAPDTEVKAALKNARTTQKSVEKIMKQHRDHYGS
jgi:hypothetical protein